MSRHIPRSTGWTIFFLLFSLCVSAQMTEAGNSRLLLPVKQGRLWGYADTMQHVIISPQFDAANPFEGKIAVVEKNRKAYAIDSTGRILTPGFDQLFIAGDSVLSIYLNMISDTLGGWGISMLSGKLVLPPAYDEIFVLNSRLYGFRKDSLWGVVTREGSIISAPAYDSLIMQRSGYVVLQKGKKFGVMGGDGKMYLDAIYTKIYFPSSFTFAGFLSNPKDKENSGWGAVNRTPEQIIPFIYDSLFRINSYFIGVKEKDSLGCYFPLGGAPTACRYKSFVSLDLYWVMPFDFSGNCGLYDTTGKLLVPVQYADVTVGGRGFWFAIDKNKKWGLYSPDGQLLHVPAYTRIVPFRTNTTVVFNGKLQGLINDKGEELIAPGDQEIIVRGNTVKLIRPDNSATVFTIDASGRITDRSNYDEFRVIKISGSEAPVVWGNTTGPTRPRPNSIGARLGGIYTARVDSLDWFLEAKRQLWGLRNSYTGDTLLRPQFEFVTPCSDGFTMLVGVRDTIDCMAIDGQATYGTQRVGLVSDTSGKFILKPKYVTIYPDDLGPHGFKGCVRATLPGGQIALVSTDGQERITPFTWIDPVQNGYARVCINGKWTVNDPGEMISPLQKFASSQSLHPFLSFGRAALSKPYMEKPLCIAGGKWGYVDSTGRVIIPAAYDGARNSAGGTGIVKQGKKWGLIDMNGAVKIPFVYDALNYLRTDSTTLVIAQNNGMRYGYIDRNGTICIPADLKQSKSLGKGFIGFSRTGKWGVMNAKGETLCAETYHEILPFSEGIAAVRLGNRWGYIDTTGAETLPPKYEKAGPFREGLARVVLNQRWGFIDRSGSLEVEANFLQAGNFSGNAAPVKTRDGWGLIDRKGKWLQKPTWAMITPLDSLARGIFVVRSENLYGLCRSDGKLILAPRYEGFKFLGEGRIGYRSGASWGLLDTTGKTVTQPVYGMLKQFSEHLAPALVDGSWGFIRPDGRFAIQPQFGLAVPFNDHRAYVMRGGRSLFIDTTGRTLLTLKSSFTLLGYSEGKYLVGTLNDRKEIKSMYFMTRHGVRVNRFDYKEAMLFGEGVARVRPGGTTWGLISFTGYYIVKPRFFVLSPFENGLARFQMRYTQGAFTLDGTPLLPVAYDAINWDADLGMIRIDKGNVMGYLFPDGRTCWPESE